VDFQLPQLSTLPYDDMLDEVELLGFCLGDIFSLCIEDGFQHTLAKDLPANRGQEVTMIGYFITTKPVRTINKQTMFFGTFVDAAGDWIDTVHFPESSRLYPLQGRGFYKIFGRIAEEFGVYTIEVLKQEKCGLKARNSL
jgi:DNA polymerase-3 subunit alpha